MPSSVGTATGRIPAARACDYGKPRMGVVRLRRQVRIRAARTAWSRRPGTAEFLVPDGTHMVENGRRAARRLAIEHFKTRCARGRLVTGVLGERQPCVFEVPDLPRDATPVLRACCPAGPEAATLAGRAGVRTPTRPWPQRPGFWHSEPLARALRRESRQHTSQAILARTSERSVSARTSPQDRERIGAMVVGTLICAVNPGSTGESGS